MAGADPISWDLYVCQGSEWNPDDFLLCQADDYGEEGGDPVEYFTGGGAVYRPRDPDPETGLGTPMLVAFDGGKRMTLLGVDTRAAQKLPTAPKGSYIAFGDTGETVLPQLYIHGEDPDVPTRTGMIELKRDEGTEFIISRGRVTMYTTEDKTATGRPVFFRVKNDAFEWEAPFGRSSFSARGWHLRTIAVDPVTHLPSEARVDVGSLGMPSPLNTLSTYANIQAANINLRGSIVSLGPDAAVLPHDAVALATPIKIFVEALSAYMEALVQATSIAIGAAGPGGPAAATVFDTSMATALKPIQAAAAYLGIAVSSKSTNSA